MAVKEVLADNRTVTLPFPASTGIAVGNLLYWDSGAVLPKTASARADKGSLALNQADFAALFVGVMVDQRLATETSTGNDSRRAITLDGIFDVDCASLTWEVDDLVGIDRNATPTNYDSQVAKVTNPALAIGIVVKREPVAVTKVRCRLTASKLWSDRLRRPLGLGGAQGVGSTALADANGAVTVGNGPILTMVPTAGRNVTLPNEAISGAMGLTFVFTNNSAGANSVTFQSSAAGSIKGNGVVPQNKTGYFWCDGTNWNGLVSA